MVLRLFRNIWKERNILIVVLTPFLLLPILVTTHAKETQCAYVILIMAVFWVTEALPIAVTSFLPIVLFPMIGMMSAKDVSAAYVNLRSFTDECLKTLKLDIRKTKEKDTSMLFLGGLLLAAALEHWTIHRRIALRVLLIFGTEPHWLLLGMMLPTWFLSMWISNTATTAMMMPIVNAVTLQLKEASTKHKEEGKEATEDLSPDIEKNKAGKKNYDTFSDSNACTSKDNSTQPLPSQESNPTEGSEDLEYIKMSKALSLCIAYSANVGGIASLTGTIPNVIMKAQSDILFQAYKAESPINFTTWLQFGLPVSAVLFIFLWLWFLFYFLKCRMLNCFSKKTKVDSTDKVFQLIKAEYSELGPVSFGQGAVIGHFCLLGILWITRDLGGVGGWGRLFPKETVSDSTPSILIAISMFCFPSRLPRLLGNNEYQGSKPLLRWRDVEKIVPWGVVILLGGGLAVAKGSQVSGLSSWLGNQLIFFSKLEPWIMNLILCYVIAAATEVTSNVAISTLMLPILIEMALTLKVNPLYFMFPGAIASSFAFMLPVATPPNAVVFSYGYVRVTDMVTVGFFLNVVSVLLLAAMTETLGNELFNFHVLPQVFTNTSNAFRDISNVTTSTTP